MFDTIEKLHRCDDCFIRRRAMARPHSVFARIHRWHSSWWPCWKSYERRLRGRKREGTPYGTMPRSRASTPVKEARS